MYRNRFSKLPEAQASALHLNLLIVEAVVEHKRSMRPVTKPVAQTSGTFLAVRRISDMPPSSSTRSA